MRFTVVTLFPEMFESFLAASLLGKAREAGLIAVDFVDPRDWTRDKHRSVDDTPYGGGPGMVMKAEPLLAALGSIEGAPRRVVLAPAGAPLTQATAVRLAGEAHVVLVCGRYEGIDERVAELAIDETISIGDYVLSGGEVAAMTVIDAVARLVPGVLGDAASAEDESFSAGLLEYPHYTRPAEVGGLAVPEVLLSGNHERIRQWRRGQSLARTRRRRPDLWRKRTVLPGDDKLDPGGEVAARSHVILLHHPVLDRLGEVVTSSVTNLDIHDIARSVSTYGLAGYWPVSPVAAQREKIAGIAATWRELAAARTENRNQALARVQVAASLEDAIAAIEARHGSRPRVVATSAQDIDTADRRVGAEALIAAAGDEPDRPLALVFGTGWGIAPEALALAEEVLDPIRGHSEFNHLSVRSAVAVILDRCFGASGGDPPGAAGGRPT
jgi:tRNA (guanine37-N1)-methyltransferase